MNCELQIELLLIIIFEQSNSLQVVKNSMKDFELILEHKRFSIKLLGKSTKKND